MNSSFGAKSTGDVDAEVNRLLYEPANKHLCKTRLITVPEPSEPDEDSNGYTRLIDPSKAEKVEIQDSVCHVWFQTKPQTLFDLKRTAHLHLNKLYTIYYEEQNDVGLIVLFNRFFNVIH